MPDARTDGPQPLARLTGKLRRPALPGSAQLAFSSGFVIVNSMTGFNLVLGMLSLICASAGAVSLAAWGLLCCVLLDGFDGALARHWKVSSDFGAQLDSLADMTSFIIAGAALIYYWVAPTPPFWMIFTASGMYSLAGAIRLARFNSVVPDRSYFQGLPTTFAAAVIAANYLVYPSFDSYWIIGLVTLLAVLMVSIFPYPKLSVVGRWLRWGWPLLIVGALISLSWTVWIAALGYICLGPAISLKRRLHKSE
ncbi:MAG: hypothetical protein OHK0022_40100 [Roseiflexaceae bacterium]